MTVPQYDLTKSPHPPAKWDHPPSPSVIARADRPVAIRIPCGAKHRPSPLRGAERERIATSGFALLAMTVVGGGWSF